MRNQPLYYTTCESRVERDWCHRLWAFSLIMWLGYFWKWCLNFSVGCWMIVQQILSGFWFGSILNINKYNWSIDQEKIATYPPIVLKTPSDLPSALLWHRTKVFLRENLESGRTRLMSQVVSLFSDHVTGIFLKVVSKLFQLAVLYVPNEHYVSWLCWA
jgi:hypothetical protein